QDTGEAAALRRLQGVDLHVTGRGFLFGPEIPEDDRAAAAEGWRLARESMASGRHRLLVLDELTYAVNRGMVDLQELIACLDGRDPRLHVVITGRDAPPSLEDLADLVTEMREVKHPLSRGVKAQAGIEF
ncbi:MAG: cob(I)yrinic acid a,c-diamide adenosyltransferase, partial [Spirochaetota bacterium]